MTLEQWLGLQDQLWSAFGPLVSWWLVFLLVGFIAAMLFMFSGVLFANWLDV